MSFINIYWKEKDPAAGLEPYGIPFCSDIHEPFYIWDLNPLVSITYITGHIFTGICTETVCMHFGY